MSHYYLDASAVVKRYSPEVGSAWVKALTDPVSEHTIVLCEITLAEVAAALAAKERAPGRLTRDERDRALALFLSHCDSDYALISGSRTIIDRAVGLTQNQTPRHDAVQLSTALAANHALNATGLGVLTFVAADDDLEAAARAEGLATENPNRNS